MVDLILNSIELKQVCELLKAESKYVGLYYYKCKPLELFKVNELLIAVLNHQSEEPASLALNYASMRAPLWQLTMPDLIKHCTIKRGNV